MTRTLLVAATLLVALTASAAGLQKYRDWDQSPQGHFMTGAKEAMARAPE